MQIILISLLLIITLLIVFYSYKDDISIDHSNGLINNLSSSQNNKIVNHRNKLQAESEKEAICKHQVIIENFNKKNFPNIYKKDKNSKKIIKALVHETEIEHLPIDNDECGANAASWLVNNLSRIGLSEKAAEYHRMLLNFAKQGNHYAIRNICIGADLLASIENRIQFCEDIFDNPKINYDGKTKFMAYKFLSSYYFDTNQGMKLVNFCEKNHDRKEVCYYSFGFPSVNRLADKLFDSKEYKKALYLYKKSAPYEEEGNIHATIGIMYMDGMGTKKDLNQAIFWFNSSLKKIFFNNKKEALIRNYVGIAYEEQNKYVDAFQFYKKSATLGYALAQFNLARLFALGHGTIQDYKEAYAWISVSIAQGLNNKEDQNKAEQFQAWFKKSLQEQDKKGSLIVESQNLAKKYYKLYVLHRNDT